MREIVVKVPEELEKEMEEFSEKINESSSSNLLSSF